MAFTAVAAGTQETTGADVTQFAAQLPIKAGDQLAIHVPKENTSSVGCDFNSGDTGDVVRWRTGNAFDDPVGTTVATDTTGPSFRLNVSARVEPDADGDGYGDLTQDTCPSLKNSHDDCIPPNTFLKSGPAKKVVTAASKAKVKITFFASEAASFTCKVDKKAATPCNGKFKAKLKPGKHTVTITATDRVGNVDPTPLVVKTKVVHHS